MPSSSAFSKIIVLASAKNILWILPKRFVFDVAFFVGHLTSHFSHTTMRRESAAFAPTVAVIVNAGDEGIFLFSRK